MIFRMTKAFFALGWFTGLILLQTSCQTVGERPVRPVTPAAAPETVELLRFLHRISGKHILSGQHNYPADKDQHTQAAAAIWGKAPAVFGKDLGFARQGSKDSAYVRAEVVEELKEQYRRGALPTLCWHAVPPTADEPVAFKLPKNSVPPPKLNTVQGRLTDAQYQELLTPGTRLHQRWCAQVDAIVPSLKQLEEARVPLLWRPYHEMNGPWFWWGGRRGPHGSAALYRMLYDRLVHHHQIKNLIWVWNVDRPEAPSLAFEECWPGSAYVDVLSFDCYYEFKQSYYDELLKLAYGKPIALGEVGNNLTLEVLQAQPRWTWWMAWADYGVRAEATNRFPRIVNDPRSWSLSDPEYRKAIAAVLAGSKR